MSDEKLQRIENVLTQLVSMVGKMNDRMDRIEDELAQFRQETNEKLDRIDQRLDLHRNRIAQNTEDIELLKKRYWAL